MEREKYIDEGWKESVQSEKTKFSADQDTGSSPKESRAPEKASAEQEDSAAAHETGINFVNYVAGLAYQAMIFLGEIPNPLMENACEVDLAQAKLIIDTLILFREKTKGNLTPDEENLINSSLYELQMKYVEKTQSGAEINSATRERKR